MCTTFAFFSLSFAMLPEFKIEFQVQSSFQTIENENCTFARGLKKSIFVLLHLYQTKNSIKLFSNASEGFEHF